MNDTTQMSIYIHIPFCMKKCNYCDFLSGVYDEDTQGKYVDALCKEIEYMGQRLDGVAVPSIFIGGGTPSWLEGKHIEKIMSVVYDNFTVPGSAEITIECNPGTVTAEKFLSIRRAGINRISIGLQSANDEELKILGRVHDFNQFLKTYEMARKTGFTNINVDIMTGLPGQTQELLLNTLENVIRLKPSHISAYSLIIEEGTPFYNLYKDDVHRRESGEATKYLPNEDAEYELTKMTEHILSQHGYHQYEISNFARDDYECQHNKVYWQRGQYIGFGIGAASLIGDCRYHNMTDIYDYIEKCNQLPVASDQNIEARLSGEESEVMYLWDSCQTLSRHDQMEEFMFLGLRMNQGVTREDFKRAFGCEIEGVYREELEKLQQEGLLVMEGGHIYLTERGRDISNVVLSEFLFD